MSLESSDLFSMPMRSEPVQTSDNATVEEDFIDKQIEVKSLFSDSDGQSALIDNSLIDRRENEHFNEQMREPVKEPIKEQIGNSFVDITKQMTNVTDPFVVQQKATNPAQVGAGQMQRAKIPQKPKPQPVKQEQSPWSKTTIILLVLIVVLVITIVVLLVIKPFKTKRDVENLNEQFNESQRQLKEYQLKIQQLETDAQEMNKARIEAINRATSIQEELDKKIAEDKILIADSKTFNKKSPSRESQRKDLYNRVANPNGSGTEDKQTTVTEVPLFKDVGGTDINVPTVDVSEFQSVQQQQIEQQQVQPQQQVQQSQQPQQQVQIDIDLDDVYN